MKTVLITGANRGIGLEFVKQYASAGWRILACCRNPEKADTLINLATQYSIGIYSLDVLDPIRIDNLAQVLSSESIDLLINNAGIYPDLETTKYEDWIKTFQINAIAPFKMAESFNEHIIRSQQKTIVTISSQMGSIKENDQGGDYLYRSSKAAVNMVVRSLAVDLAPSGVIAIVLDPGWVKTNMGGPDALLTVEESVTEMRNVISGLTLSDSGKFLNYKNQVVAW